MADHAPSFPENKDEEDDESRLERMLLQAERLAAQMRSASQRQLDASEGIMNELDETSQAGTYSAMSIASMDTEDVSHAEVILSSSNLYMQQAPSVESAISGSLTKGTFFKPPKHRESSAQEDRRPLVMLAEETEEDLMSPVKYGDHATSEMPSAYGAFDPVSKRSAVVPAVTPPTDARAGKAVRPPRAGEVPTTIDVARAANGQADVEAAIKASQEMAMALQALGGAPAPSPSSRKSGSTSVYGSNLTPASAEISAGGMQYDDDRLLAHSRVRDIDGAESSPAKVNLDKSHFSIDTDDSPSKSSPKARSIVVENGIKWEKVSYAEQNDEDYVPLSDYSSPATPPKSSYLSVAPAGQTYAQQRAALRRRRMIRRKRRLVAAAALLILAVVGGGWYYLRRFVFPSSVAGEQKDMLQAEPKKPLQTHEGGSSLESSNEGSTAQGDSEAVKETSREYVAEVQAEKKEVVLEVEVQTRETLATSRMPTTVDPCNMPFAAFLSPVCSHGQSNFSSRQKVELLLQVMMQ